LGDLLGRATKEDHHNLYLSNLVFIGLNNTYGKAWKEKEEGQVRRGAGSGVRGKTEITED
jgi:hypothetical protein